MDDAFGGACQTEDGVTDGPAVGSGVAAMTLLEATVSSAETEERTAARIVAWTSPGEMR